MNKVVQKTDPERGGAGVKFLIALCIVVLIGNAALNYVPVAYDAGNFKQEMETTVVQALAMPGTVKPVDVVKNRITRAAKEDNIPADMWLEVKPNGNIIQARVVYTKQVALLPFGMWNYAYHFDHTATPQGFLVKDQQGR
jgi:hypothetical protein